MVDPKKLKSNPSHGSSDERCMCSWKKPDAWPVTSDLETDLPWCEYLRQKTAQHADNNHVWNGDTHKIKGMRDINNCSDKVTALRMSLQHHVPGFKENSDLPHFVVARHHFPQALLECRPAWKIKYATPFLSQGQAELVAEKDYGKGRVTESCNLVSKLLAKAGGSLSKPADGNKFVQAPVTSKVEVEDFVKSLLSPAASLRLHRRFESVTKAEEEATIVETVETPVRSLFVTPETHLSIIQSISRRESPTLPYQPEDRGVPASPKAASRSPNSPDVGLSRDFCRDKLKKKFELGDIDPKSLRFNNNFAICMHTLATYHKSFEPIKLMDDNGYFYPCYGQHPDNEKDTDCETYCVKPRRTGTFGYCAPCYEKRKLFLQKARRKEERVSQKEQQVVEGVEPEQVSSTRPFSTMSPVTAMNQLRANAVKRKNAKKKISYLQTKLDVDKNIMEINVSDKGIRDMLVNVSGIVLTGKWNAKQAIIDTLLVMESKDGGLDKASDQERLIFAENTLNEIKNMSKRMTSGSGKTQQRYSPKLIRITMALWLRDNKAYEEFQQSGLYMMPSVALLNKIKGSFKTRDGEDPKIYCRYKDERQHGKSNDGEVGHLMVDEIKLKSDLAFKASSQVFSQTTSRQPTEKVKNLPCTQTNGAFVHFST